MRRPRLTATRHVSDPHHGIEIFLDSNKETHVQCSRHPRRLSVIQGDRLIILSHRVSVARSFVPGPGYAPPVIPAPSEAQDIRRMRDGFLEPRGNQTKASGSACHGGGLHREVPAKSPAKGLMLSATNPPGERPSPSWSNHPVWASSFARGLGLSLLFHRSCLHMEGGGWSTDRASLVGNGRPMNAQAQRRMDASGPQAISKFSLRIEAKQRARQTIGVRLLAVPTGRDGPIQINLRRLDGV